MYDKNFEVTVHVANIIVLFCKKDTSTLNAIDNAIPTIASEKAKIKYKNRVNKIL